MKSITIEGTKRTEVGGSAARAARKEGTVPCVIYGGKENVHFSSKVNAFKTLLYTPDFMVAEVNVDGASYKCFVKDSQFHPVTDTLMHVDFQELVPGRKVNVEVPVKFVGSSPGVKEGGKLIQNIRRVKIKTTPENLVEELILDISELKLGSSIRVRDIKVEEGVEIMVDAGTPIAGVEVPRALKSAEAAAEEVDVAAPAAEPEAEA